MDLIFRRNDGKKAFRPLLTEKIGGGITTIFTREKGW